MVVVWRLKRRCSILFVSAVKISIVMKVAVPVTVMVLVACLSPSALGRPSATFRDTLIG